MIKRRILYAVAGLVYGIALGFWAMLISGGGHFNFPIILIISPMWFGLLLWPLWGFMAGGFNSIASKGVFLLSMMAHFVGIIIYVKDAWDSDMYWFRVGMHSPVFVVFPASVVVLYLAAQFFLWLRFLQDSFGSSDGRKITARSHTVGDAI